MPNLADGSTEALYHRGHAIMIGKHPHSYYWFAAGDFAQMVSKAYQNSAASIKRFFIHGPEAARIKEALESYAIAFQLEIRTVTVISVWAAKAIAPLTRN